MQTINPAASAQPPKQITCPQCNGEKQLFAMGIVYAPTHTGPRPPCKMMPCFKCNGKGTIPEPTPEQLAWQRIGEAMRQERLARSVGLRCEAERRGILPSDLSKMEHGEIEPIPSPDIAGEGPAQ